MLILDCLWNWQTFTVPGSSYYSSCTLTPEGEGSPNVSCPDWLNTVSSFVGHSKKIAWATRIVFPELTNVLLILSSAPSVTDEDAMQTIERFVILIYDKTSSFWDIDTAQRKIFAKKNNVKHIPPTKTALEPYVKRATYRGSHVWGQLLLASPLLPPPTS